MLSTHPALEVHYPVAYSSWKGGKTHNTDVDVFELFSDHTVFHKKNMNQADLKARFDREVTQEESMARILFINDLDFSPKLDTNEDALFEPDTTIIWLLERFQVSPLYFRLIRELRNMNEGRKAAYVRCDNEGKPVSFDGFYTCWLYTIDRNTLIWFSHDMASGGSTYLMYGLPEDSKRYCMNLHQANCPRNVHHPVFTVDVLLCRLALVKTQTTLSGRGNEVNEMEKIQLGDVVLGDKETITAAHLLAKNLYASQRELAILREVIQLIDNARRRWNLLQPSHEETKGPAFMKFDSVLESIAILHAEIKDTETWTNNYINRCSIRLNLLFNLLTQRDNRTNLGIAEYTSKISEATQRDSASMITMAVVTMVFLPGTFVSAIFSMSFFDKNTAGDGISVTRDWTLYLAVTIPLTILVFVVWSTWRQIRLRKQSKRTDLKQTEDKKAESMQNEGGDKAQHNADADQRSTGSRLIEWVETRIKTAAASVLGCWPRDGTRQRDRTLA